MKYKIAYSYTKVGIVEVEANSLAEASELALEASQNNSREYFVQHSFEVDHNKTALINKE